jgi:hypothetical protein
MAPKRTKTKAPEGASLREAAAALGITRAALLKFIDRGLPSPLVRERRTVDIEAARAWIEEHEAAAIVEDRMVLPLNPDDPRAKRDRASAKLKAYKMALDHGHAIPIDVASARYGRALTEFNSALKTIPASVADKLAIMNRKNAAAILAPFIEDALGFVDADDEEGTKAFLQPLDIVIDFPSDEVDEFEAFAPILSPADDRAKLANMQAAKYNAEATALANSVVFYEDVTVWLADLCEKVRARFREVPAAVAAMLASDGNQAHFVRECVLYQLDRARLDCGGQSQGELVEPKPDNVVDDEPLEEVDGLAELEHEESEAFEDA